MKKFLVGGAVRDKVLGLEPKDRDWLIVGATPHEVEVLVQEGYKQVGADFPVFLHPTTGEEYALARVERKTGAGYGGFTVQFDENVTLEEDLARRDLTINSMALDEEGKLHDPFGGYSDIEDRVLRHTTEAFAEDPLRVLRLARFAARYEDFTVAPETIALCRSIAQSGELNELTEERIWVELEKAFSEVAPHRFLEVLDQCCALRGCRDLSLLFGIKLHAEDVAMLKNLYTLPKEDRLVAALACFAGSRSRTDEFVAMSSRVKAAMNNVSKMLAETERTGSCLMYLLVMFGSMREGTAFQDVLNVMSLKGDFLFTREEMVWGQVLMKDVKASDFPGVEGKALGGALNNARLDKLNHAVMLWNS